MLLYALFHDVAVDFFLLTVITIVIAAIAATAMITMARNVG